MIFQTALGLAAMICVWHLARTIKQSSHHRRTGQPVAVPDALGRRWVPIPELGFGMFAFCFTGLVTLGLRADGGTTLPMKQVLFAAVIFGYAGAALSRVVRTPGPAGRRVPLRAGLLLGLPALFGVVFGLSSVT
ncbi:hypothetical protein [Kribbella deserti]|uniref:Uncharacterized protein n=1 Tax=Kribbella deserti TaxID=1926257 RepID=A0ABV6QN74_9ACTN